VSAGDPGPWYERAFRRRYLEVYAHRDAAAAAREARFIAGLLRRPAAARVLDAGCGAGRHARALEREGFDVVGLDLSADLLAAARTEAAGPHYVRADVRALPFGAGVFDGAVSLFTTFGYFDDAANLGHLLEIRRVLRAGAPYVLDFLNAPRVRANLVPASEKTVGDLRITERRRIRAGRVEKDVEIRTAGSARVSERWSESVRLYDREELVSLAERAGLRVLTVFGDLSGGSWSRTADRLVVRTEAA